jgi:hypothetical protein
VSDQLAGGDPASDSARTYAKHLRYLGDGEELDSLASIMATVPVQRKSFCFCAAATITATVAV